MKLFNINSIQSRMLSGFLFLTLLIIIIAFASLYLLDRTRSITSIHNNLNRLQVYTLHLIKADNDFFDQEIFNQKYFASRHSPLIKKRDSLNLLLKADIALVYQKSARFDYPVTTNLQSIDSLLRLYNARFTRLETLLFTKGFRDFGLEGQMRNHAHALENPYSGITLTQILSLRRIEKDFFLRHDTIYIHNFNKEYNILLTESLAKLPPTHSAIFHLTEYARYVNQLTTIQKEIGLTGLDGLRWELNNLTEQLSREYFIVTEYSNDLNATIQKEARIFYILMMTGAIAFSILSGFWISKRLSEPIARLSKMIDIILTRKRKNGLTLSLENAAQEINTLTNSFNKLLNQTSAQMDEIEIKSKLLKERNTELKKLNKELDNFLYSTAHDLRSPLTSLLGLINLLHQENRQSNLVPYFNMMQTSIHRQEDFIVQIVSYAKNKKMDIFREKLDLHKIISEIFESHRFLEGAERIEKRIEIKEICYLFSDRNRLMIIFNNLISNAFRYADPTKEKPFIHIKIRISFTEITIEFNDNGLGIEQEHLGRIFDMFYRANINSKGSGLGLYIFKETILKLGGLVSVESQPGTGTKFFITLPNLYTSNEREIELPLAPDAPFASVSSRE